MTPEIEGNTKTTKNYRQRNTGETQALGRNFLSRGQESIAHLWIQAKKGEAAHGQREAIG